MPAQAERAEQAGAEILELCVAVGGCLTGEHGVGIEKRDLMRVQFTETDLALQMRIKTVFDPKWLLNPAKVFPLEGREARRMAKRQREESSRCSTNMRPVDERECSRVLAEATATAHAGRGDGRRLQAADRPAHDTRRPTYRPRACAASRSTSPARW